jgi:hypothetical protein
MKTEMTLGLAVKIRDYYVKHTEVAKMIEDVQDCLNYLDDLDLDLGMCNLADKKFFFDIYSSQFINKIVGERTLFAYKIPMDCSTHSEIIASLQYRINLLNEFINEHTPKTVKFDPQ